MTDPVTHLNTALEGRYSIDRELGEGGMATVYLADDIKHERKVALKVLKPELAAVVGAERFLAEIKVTANLQHPNILPLHDSGETDGFLFYVMPYVEGDTLKGRLEREHQLPVADAVQIATDMAEALDYAHRQGVIHRDIKPANVLLLEGKPVISDFGIALAVGAAGGGRLTETGLSLGTPHYMSPEQATGDQTVGGSTDTYALGSVLYEMLVGEPPYPGTTAQAVLGKIIAGKLVSATEQRPSVPANVDGAVRKALEKLPADRFTSVQEFARALADPGFRHGEVAVAEVAAAVGPWKRLSVGFAVLAGVFGLGLGWALLRPEPPQPVTRIAMIAPDHVTMVGLLGMAVSPDGRTVVFAGAPNGQLYHRDLRGLDPVPIPGTERAWYPFFSPDGEWVAYFDQGENVLTKIRLDGSQAQRIAPVSGRLRSAGWGSDGTIVLAAGDLDGLWRVRDTGGELEPIADTDGPQLRWLDLLPGGRTVLGHSALDGVNQVVAVSLETGERTVLFAGTTPRYVSSSYVVFWREDGLWAVRFDPERARALGPATPIVEGVPAGPNGFGEFAVGGDVLFHGEGAGQARHLITPFQEGAPVLSPDGRWLAYVSDKSGQAEIYVQPYPGPGPEFTVTTAGGWEPLWSRDGSELFYRGPEQLMVVAVELGETFRGGTPRPLFADSYLPGNTPTSAPNYDITPDGQRFVMVRVGSSEEYGATVVLNFSEELKRLVPN